MQLKFALVKTYVKVKMHPEQIYCDWEQHLPIDGSFEASAESAQTFSHSGQTQPALAQKSELGRKR